MEGRKLAYYEMVDLEQADQSIKACLLDAGRNVIAVGYYLKVIRDRELFRDSGYETIWDYARETYGFSKSTASRYMARNDRFSVGGNSRSWQRSTGSTAGPSSRRCCPWMQSRWSR